MMPTDMKLPELGENIEGGDVLRVMVKPGDAIKKDQPVLELETDKATIEVPSSADRRRQGNQSQAGREGEGRPDDFHRRREWAGAAAGEDGSKACRPADRRRHPPSNHAAPAPVAPKPAEPAKAEKRKAEVVEMKPSKQAAASAPRRRAGEGGRDAASIPAAPSARRLARELGVNIQDIQGSGPGGRISMDDVTAYARRLLSGAGAARSPAAAGERCPTSANGERSSASR